MRSWYKIAKIGEQYLKAKGVSDVNMPAFKAYLDSLPDSAAKYLMNNFIVKNPNMSVEDLKEIPVEVRETTINPKMEDFVKRITQDGEEREWLRNMVEQGIFKEEDVIKFYGFLNDLHNLSDRKLTSFKDDIALSKHILGLKGSSEIKGLPEDGNDLLEDEMVDNVNLKLYRITNQESLDAIGGNADWCVLSEKGGAEYQPFEYYCFVLDAVAEVLVHTASYQIKDRNDASLSLGSMVKLIDPYVKKYGMIDRKYRMKSGVPEGSEEDDNFDDENSDEDIIRYKEITERIEEIAIAAESGGEAIYEELNDHPSNFSLIPRKDWAKYVEYFGDRLTLLWYEGVDDVEGWKGIQSESIEMSGYVAVEYLATHLQLTNDMESFNKLEKMVAHTYCSQDRDLTTGRYKKLVPPVLRTTYVNEVFNVAREEAMTKWEEKLRGDYAKIADCPFKELVNDPSIKEEAYQKYKANLKKQPWDVANHYAMTTGFRKRLMDEGGWDDELMGSWIQLLKESSIQELFYMPNIWGKHMHHELSKDPNVIDAAKQAITNDLAWSDNLSELIVSWERINIDFPATPMNPSIETPFKYSPEIFGIVKSKLLAADISNLPGWEVMKITYELPGYLARILDPDPETQLVLKNAWRELITRKFFRAEFLVKCPYEDIKNEFPEAVIPDETTEIAETTETVQTDVVAKSFNWYKSYASFYL
jgi:hypothetical protein